jgi:hypothetical protein
MPCVHGELRIRLALQLLVPVAWACIPHSTKGVRTVSDAHRALRASSSLAEVGFATNRCITATFRLRRKLLPFGTPLFDATVRLDNAGDCWVIAVKADVRLMLLLILGGLLVLSWPWISITGLMQDWHKLSPIGKFAGTTILVLGWVFMLATYIIIVTGLRRSKKRMIDELRTLLTGPVLG